MEIANLSLIYLVVLTFDWCICEARRVDFEHSKVRILRDSVEKQLDKNFDGRSENQTGLETALQNMLNAFGYDMFCPTVTELIKLLAANCQSTSASTTTTTSPATTTSKFLDSCDNYSGWKYYNGHCYLLVEERKNWDSASENCKNRGGYLVDMSSEAEFEFISELINYKTTMMWIGASDKEKKGKFVFTRSGKEVPKKYWDKYFSQPDNLEVESCVSMRWNGDVELYNYRCDNDNYFVCETP